MPAWLEEKLRSGGVDNPYALMNAVGIKKGDTHASVSKKMSTYQKARKHLKKRGK